MGSSKHYSPTQRKSGLEKIWQYFWNLEKLYDPKTNTAYCVHTGQQIEMKEATRRKIPCYAFQYSVSLASLLMYIIKLFRDYSTVLPIVYTGCATIIGILLFHFLRRLNFAGILARADWIPVSNNLPAANVYTEELEQNASVENRFVKQMEMNGLLLGVLVGWLFM